MRKFANYLVWLVFAVLINSVFTACDLGNQQEPQPLTGEVIIRGEPIVGNTLTAEVHLTGPAASLSDDELEYTWRYWDNDDVICFGKTLTVQSEMLNRRMFYFRVGCKNWDNFYSFVSSDRIEIMQRPLSGSVEIVEYEDHLSASFSSDIPDIGDHVEYRWFSNTTGYITSGQALSFWELRNSGVPSDSEIYVVVTSPNFSGEIQSENYHYFYKEPSYFSLEIQGGYYVGDIVTAVFYENDTVLDVPEENYKWYSVHSMDDPRDVNLLAEGTKNYELQDSDDGSRIYAVIIWDGLRYEAWHNSWVTKIFSGSAKIVSPNGLFRVGETLNVEVTSNDNYNYHNCCWYTTDSDQPFYTTSNSYLTITEDLEGKSIYVVVTSYEYREGSITTPQTSPIVAFDAVQVPITGTVKITGSLTVGGNLYAEYQGNAIYQNTNYFTYEWFKDGQPYDGDIIFDGGACIGTSPYNYDSGSLFKVVVTGIAPYCGSIESEEFGPIIGPEKIIGTVVIEGTFKPGETLKAVYNGNAGDKVTYLWRRDGSGFGANGSTCTLSDSDIGKKISVEVSGVNSGYTGFIGSIKSKEYGPVTKEFTGTAKISNNGPGLEVKVGSTLYAKYDGDFSGGNLKYQWYADDEKIKDEVFIYYTVGLENLGKKIKVEIYCSREGYYGSIFSKPTDTVISGETLNISIAPYGGDHCVGDKLFVTTGSSYDISKNQFQWYADGEEIEGATEINYTVQMSDLGKKLKAKMMTSKGYVYTSETQKVRYELYRLKNENVDDLFVLTGTPKLGNKISIKYIGPGAEHVTGVWKSNYSGKQYETDEFTPEITDCGQTFKYTITPNEGEEDWIGSLDKEIEIPALPFTGKVTVTGSPIVGNTLTAKYEGDIEEKYIRYSWNYESGNSYGYGSSLTISSYSKPGTVIFAKAYGAYPYYVQEPVESSPITFLPALTNNLYISGSVVEGETVSAEYNSGDFVIDFTYQWYIDDEPIAGATNKTYTITEADALKKLSVEVTCSSGTKKSSNYAVSAIVRGTLVVNDLFVGHDRSCTYDGNADGHYYVYYYFEDDVDQNNPITNRFSESDLGKKVYAVLEGSGNYTGSIKSELSGIIKRRLQDGSLTITSPDMQLTQGQSNTISVGTVLNAEYEYTNVISGYQWYADDLEIEGATEQSFTVTKNERNKEISVKVIPNELGDGTKTSTTKVKVENNLEGSVRIEGIFKVGETVTAVYEGDEAEENLVYYWKYGENSSFSSEGTKTYDLTNRGDLYLSVRSAYRNGSISCESVRIKGEVYSFDLNSTHALVGDELKPNAYSTDDETFQWYRDGVAIEGATDYKYTVTEEDAGKKVSLKITAQDDGYYYGEKTSNEPADVFIPLDGNIEITGTFESNSPLVAVYTGNAGSNVLYSWKSGSINEYGTWGEYSTDNTYLVRALYTGYQNIYSVKVKGTGIYDGELSCEINLADKNFMNVVKVGDSTISLYQQAGFSAGAEARIICLGTENYNRKIYTKFIYESEEELYNYYDYEEWILSCGNSYIEKINGKIYIEIGALPPGEHYLMLIKNNKINKFKIIVANNGQ